VTDNDNIMKLTPGEWQFGWCEKHQSECKVIIQFYEIRDNGVRPALLWTGCSREMNGEEN